MPGQPTHGIGMSEEARQEQLTKGHLGRAIQSPGGFDAVTAYFPYSDDPRFAHKQDQMHTCYLRFMIFNRCARELGEDNARCKYQFFRAQTACFENQLEDWMEHRARGTSQFDQMPDRDARHLRT